MDLNIAMTVEEARNWYKALKKVSCLEQDANRLREEALIAHGWKAISQTPNFSWMWEKEINGARYLVTIDKAVSLMNGAAHLAFAGAAIT
jgi:hypothetical protein